MLVTVVVDQVEVAAPRAADAGAQPPPEPDPDAVVRKALREAGVRAARAARLRAY